MKQAKPFTITGGRLVMPGSISDGSVRVADGLIDAVGDISPQPGDEVVDARGALVAPALIDLGVFEVDKPACHFGGIVRAALMPDGDPPLDYPARVRFMAASGKPDLWVHPLAAATVGLAGDHLCEAALMRDAGARAIATGRNQLRDAGVMLRLLQYAAMLDMTVIAHAEDASLTSGAVATAGEMATRLGLRGAPAEAEALAIARDLTLADMAGARLHFRQVTTRAGLALVRAAKSRGQRVTAGVTPPHFMLSDLALAEFRTFARLSPPLRCEDDRHAVIEAIGDGTIDVIASGHDPRGPEDKRLPFADSAPGMAGAETLLPMALSLVRDGVLSMADAFTKMTSAPAHLLGLDSGALASGMQGDIVLVDPEKPWIVDSGKMAASAGNTPFDRQPVQGRALRLYKAGVPLPV